MRAEIQPLNLQFKFKAGTSRGVLTEKHNYLLKIYSNNAIGIGEAGPLSGLSIDDVPFFKYKLQEVASQVQYFKHPNSKDDVYSLLSQIELEDYPSIKFALEVALLDLIHGGKRKIFDCAFYDNHKSIDINGLIWMNTKEHMKQQIESKIQQGFSCVKMKIGAIDLSKNTNC